jgi:Tfp pilus assembly protein PilF
MRSFFRGNLLLWAALLAAVPASAQAGADDICRDSGQMPSREIGRQGKLAQFVFGRVIIKDLAPDAPRPRVTVTYSDIVQPATRQLLRSSGNYCFRRLGASALVVVEVDGVEVGRRSFSDLGDIRQREDFEVASSRPQQLSAPGVVSTRFTRPPNDKTTEIYKQAAAAENRGDISGAVDRVKEIVIIDPDDFIAWAKLGSLYLHLDQPVDAENAFKRALALRKDYTTVLMNYGSLLAVQARIPEAIDLFKRAVVSDPASARAYRLLGEAFLQDRQGTMGLAALDEALRLEPIAMAECHLLKARLYDLAGAKGLASREYKAYLTKVPDSVEKANLERYIKDHPE